MACPYNIYSAPAGQAWNPKPHSRCTWLNVDVPMIVENGSWIGSEIPDGCKKLEQGKLFE